MALCIEGNIDKTAFGQEDGELISVLDNLLEKNETFDTIKSITVWYKLYFRKRNYNFC
jgi:hypothetical protein